MLDFLGLPWNERVPRFHETERPVRYDRAAALPGPPQMDAIANRGELFMEFGCTGGLESNFASRRSRRMAAIRPTRKSPDVRVRAHSRLHRKRRSNA
jgi:hypothetical protein